MLAADVARSPVTGSPADDASALAAATFAVRPGKKRGMVLSGAPAGAVPHAGVKAQRRDVDDQQAECGEDEAERVAEGVTDDQDDDDGPRERRLTHASDGKRPPGGFTIAHNVLRCVPCQHAGSTSALMKKSMIAFGLPQRKTAEASATG